MNILLPVVAAVSLKQAVLDRVDEIRPRMLEVNRAIWTYAEPGLEETRSSEELQGWPGTTCEPTATTPWSRSSPGSSTSRRERP